MAPGIDHVSVTVSDLDRSVRFYHELLGIPLLGRGEESTGPGGGVLGTPNLTYRYADLDLGDGQILELLHPLPSPHPADRAAIPAFGGGHLGLRVANLDSVLRRLRADGITPVAPPVRLEEPAWWRGARCVYVGDPDGVTIELVERTSEEPA